jgi:hypothetical protein
MGMTYPPIPTEVLGLIGPIRVEIVDGLVDEKGAPVQGLWLTGPRVIQIAKSEHPANDWWTFYHELTHSWIEDLRIAMPLATEERICDGVALARVQEMRR